MKIIRLKKQAIVFLCFCLFITGLAGQNPIGSGEGWIRSEKNLITNFYSM